MKMNISAVLAFSTALFPLTGVSEESKVKDSDAKPAVIQHTIIPPIFSTHGPFIPRVSILDKPIKMKMEVIPVIHSERSSDLSFNWLK
jgi:hypothetical protein